MAGEHLRTLHHLANSQSERIVWLCEELQLDYCLRRYARRSHDRLAPEEYRLLHPMGTAPVITDGPIVLAESGAVVEYLLTNYGEGRLTVDRTNSAYPDYLYWFHFANGTLQPALLQTWLLERVASAKGEPILQRATSRRELILSTLDSRLARAPFLAGPMLTAADIMTVFSLTTMRRFYPYEIQSRVNIIKYLRRISTRRSYQEAMQKAEPGEPPFIPQSSAIKKD